MKRLLLSALLAGYMAFAAQAQTGASFPGGISALSNFIIENLRYPAQAAENGIEGKVLVQFIVDKDGKITEPKIVRPVDPDLEAEAIRLVRSMPDWIPATDDSDTPVSSIMTLPVSFKISE